jgi:hypothetical protein
MVQIPKSQGIRENVKLQKFMMMRLAFVGSEKDRGSIMLPFRLMRIHIIHAKVKQSHFTHSN